ncbi:MAG: hypothetical protein H0U76_03145 [Ktedonobacteraceae bacterium]|nr:hypothetical protein [Ktedonobacteraceae bacterium]
MFHKQSALVGVFDDTAKADRAVEELRSSGIVERQMRRAEKTAGWDIAHAIPKRKETSEEMKPDFADPGISEDEARYYEDAYEAGYIVLVVHPGEHRQQAQSILEHNDAYNYENRASGDPQGTGGMTPGMRGEDSTSPDGIADNAEGEHAAKFDEATVEADVEHAEKILEQKYQARKAQGLE